MKSIRPLIIPFFIPHMGCPHTCLFCDQKHITGRHTVPGPDDIKETIAGYLESSGSSRSPVEVAFFGGSFTAIQDSLREMLLESVQPFIRRGQVQSIRVSTRPDCISKQTCDSLRCYGVDIVELGAQSFHDHVLSASLRGHRADDTIRAVNIIREAHLKPGIQLMPGLPGETREEALESARTARDLCPSCVRIYPTVVIDNTGLADMYRQGLYTPLSFEEAIETSADMTQIIEKAGIPVIRIGLHPLAPHEQLSVLAGPYHPALGFLVRSRMKRRILDKAIIAFKKENDITGKNIIANIPFIGKEEYIGMAKDNILYLKKKYSLNNLRFYPSPDILIPEYMFEK